MSSCNLDGQSTCDRTCRRAELRESWRWMVRGLLGYCSQPSLLSQGLQSRAIQNWDCLQDRKCRHAAWLIQRRPTCFSGRGRTNIFPGGLRAWLERHHYTKVGNGWGPWLFKISSSESVQMLEFGSGPRDLCLWKLNTVFGWQLLRARGSKTHACYKHAACTSTHPDVLSTLYWALVFGSVDHARLGLLCPSGFCWVSLTGSTRKSAEGRRKIRLRCPRPPPCRVTSACVPHLRYLSPAFSISRFYNCSLPRSFRPSEGNGSLWLPAP